MRCQYAGVPLQGLNFEAKLIQAVTGRNVHASNLICKPLLTRHAVMRGVIDKAVSSLPSPDPFIDQSILHVSKIYGSSQHFSFSRSRPLAVGTPYSPDLQRQCICQIVYVTLCKGDAANHLSLGLNKGDI
jgi:hypothetical protein